MRSMSVIAGFDPAIHRAEAQFDSWMDARVKPAHDEWMIWRMTPCRYFNVIASPLKSALAINPT